MIELAYFGGFSQGEIARLLEIPLGTVKGRTRLALEKIPRLSSSEVDETWLQRGSEIEPSSTFIVDRDGTGAATIPDVKGADR